MNERTEQPPVKSQEQKDNGLLLYLRQNIERSEFAVARRQGFKRVLGIVGDREWDIALLKEQANSVMQERDGYKALATAIYGSATGRFTAEQITAHALLSDKQKQDCLGLIAQHNEANPPAYDEPFHDQIEMGLRDAHQREASADADIHLNERIG